MVESAPPTSASPATPARATMLGIAIISLAMFSSTVISSTPAMATARPADAGCGSRSIAEPSHEAPPGPHWLAGSARVYCADFTGSSLPSGWGVFSGVPQGDPSGYFDPSHVVVSGGMLSLVAARDPAVGGNWATGGVCQCGLQRMYGTFLVRSRLTGAGVDEVQMLWPVAHVWPPEVDFNETGRPTTKTAWYVHYHSARQQVAKSVRINMLAWHTWGVRWSPRSMVFTVDGRVWGVVRTPSVIPHEPMTLDMSQQTWCGIAPECPTRTASMQIDWVAEYT